MTIIRAVYEFGLEATLQPSGWVVSSAESTEPEVFASLSEVSAKLGHFPCLITERYADCHESSSLLRTDSRRRFGLGISGLLGRLTPDALYTPHHIAYLVGALAYHCERMAETYAAICRNYVDISRSFSSLPGGPSERAVFQNQTEPYYEFDAAVTAALRAYDTSRYLLWRRFGSGELPSSFERVLRAKSNAPAELYARLKQSWDDFGVTIKEYRDCIQHYVPIDLGISSVDMRRVAGEYWSVRVRIPDDPSVRSKRRFTYALGHDALSYTRKVAEEILEVMTLIIDRTARPPIAGE